MTTRARELLNFPLSRKRILHRSNPHSSVALLKAGGEMVELFSNRLSHLWPPWAKVLLPFSRGKICTLALFACVSYMCADNSFSIIIILRFWVAHAQQFTSAGNTSCPPAMCFPMGHCSERRCAGGSSLLLLLIRVNNASGGMESLANYPRTRVFIREGQASMYSSPKANRSHAAFMQPCL